MAPGCSPIARGAVRGLTTFRSISSIPPIPLFGAIVRAENSHASMAWDCFWHTPRNPIPSVVENPQKISSSNEKKKPPSTKGRKPERSLPVNRAGLQRTKKPPLKKRVWSCSKKLLVELVAAGQWFETSRLEKLEKQSKQLSDSHLPASMFILRRLMLLGKQKEISEEERMAYAADLVGQLWATVQIGRNYLENRLSGNESQTDVDAVIEDVLGKTWQMAELKEKGYTQSNLSLFELAYERTDDEARQQRMEISNLIDLGSGTIYQGITYRPFKGLNQIPDQTSFMVPITVAEAAIYPGFINRRIRWEKGSEQLIETGASKHLDTVYNLAIPDFKTVLEAFRGQLKHPLSPREAVALVRCERIGKVSDKVVIEDSTGTRIEAQDKRKDYSNVSNLVRATGMLGKDKPALLIRLFLLPLPNTVVALPLAAVTPKHHLRLGL